MERYKYYLALTSQLPFCSVPLRIDTYNNCQFGCAFCFSKARGGQINSSKNQAIKVDNLKQRLARIKAGDVRSAVDEFLERRVPVQLGGMNDPFSPWETDLGVTKETLKILASHDYPTIISTKSSQISDPEVLGILSEGNFYVRQSITPLPKILAKQVEKGVPTMEERLQATRVLAENEIPTSIRLQPIFYGYEEYADNLIAAAANAGAKHVSVEYLKWPIESASKQFSDLQKNFPNMLEKYKGLGATMVGRELVLPAEAKAKPLNHLRKTAEDLGIMFGFAENEFMLLNKFQSCCNGADIFLRNANFFEANITGIIRRQLGNNKLTFELPENIWLPSENMFSHLNSSSRPREIEFESNRDRWSFYLAKKWNSKKQRGGPNSFWGFEDANQIDNNGNRVFQQSEKHNLFADDTF